MRSLCGRPLSQAGGPGPTSPSLLCRLRGLLVRVRLCPVGAEACGNGVGDRDLPVLPFKSVLQERELAAIVRSADDVKDPAVASVDDALEVVALAGRDGPELEPPVVAAARDLDVDEIGRAVDDRDAIDEMWTPQRCIDAAEHC